jgi:hypothetical protein
MNYLAGRRLNQEAKLVDVGSDPWTLLAVVKSYYEQHPIDLALHRSATTPDGERQKHYFAARTRKLLYPRPARGTSFGAVHRERRRASG